MKKFDLIFEKFWPFSKEKTKEIRVLLTINDNRKDRQVNDIINKPESSKLSDQEFAEEYYKKKNNKYVAHLFGGEKIVSQIRKIKVLG